MRGEERAPVPGRLWDAHAVIGLARVQLLRVGRSGVKLQAGHRRDEEVAARELEADRARGEVADAADRVEGREGTQVVVPLIGDRRRRGASRA